MCPEPVKGTRFDKLSVHSARPIRGERNPSGGPFVPHACSVISPELKQYARNGIPGWQSPRFQRLPTTSTWLPAIQREARLFSGVSRDPSVEELAAIAEFYRVFRCALVMIKMQAGRGTAWAFGH